MKTEIESAIKNLGASYDGIKELSGFGGAEETLRMIEESIRSAIKLLESLQDKSDDICIAEILRKWDAEGVPVKQAN
jgi:hypothetical protein